MSSSFCDSLEVVRLWSEHCNDERGARRIASWMAMTPKQKATCVKILRDAGKLKEEVYEREDD